MHLSKSIYLEIKLLFLKRNNFFAFLTKMQKTATMKKCCAIIEIVSSKRLIKRKGRHVMKYAGARIFKNIIIGNM
jgi:hypothetical protein